MGGFDLDLRSIQSAAKVPPGSDFVVDQWFLINDKYPAAKLRLKFSYKFFSTDKSAESEQAIAAKEAKRATVCRLTDTLLDLLAD